MKNAEKQVYIDMINYHGKEILASSNMQKEQQFYQHGMVTVYEHSMKVAVCCLKLADVFNVNVDTKTLVRGALLHDYFLYDWHQKDDGSHRLHGFRHAKVAYQNASKEFVLNKKEKNMIISHMFPLNLVLPKYKESVILTIADKICAFCETVDSVLVKVKDYY